MGNPYDTFAEGLAGVSSGGTTKIKGNACDVVSGWTVWLVSLTVAAASLTIMKTIA